MPARSSARLALLTQVALLAVIVYGSYSLLKPFVWKELPFYSPDMSIIDLMARHFARGEFRLYYWGQRFYGVLDPILLIPLFAAFGHSLQTSQLLPFANFLLLNVVYAYYLRRTWGPWQALASTLLFALPGTFFLRPIFSSYNYGLGASLGLAVLWLAHGAEERPSPHRFAILGLVAGFGFYYHRMIILFFGAIAWDMFIRQTSRWDRAVLRSEAVDYVRLASAENPYRLAVWYRILRMVALVLLGAGLLLWLTGPIETQILGQKMGVSAWHTLRLGIQAVLFMNLVAHFNVLQRWVLCQWRHPLIGPAIRGFLLGYGPALLALVLRTSGPDAPGKIVSLPGIVRNSVLFATGMIPSLVTAPGFWGVFCWIVLAGGALALAVVIARATVGQPEAVPVPLAYLFPLTLLFGLGGVDLVNALQGRYFAFLWLALPVGIVIFAEWLVRWSRWVGVAVVLLGAVGSAQGLRSLSGPRTSGIPMEPIARYLTEQGVQGGYAPYWIAYPVATITDENVVMIATDEDRYPPYGERVRNLQKLVWIDKRLPLARTIALDGATFRVEKLVHIEGLMVLHLERQ